MKPNRFLIPALLALGALAACSDHRSPSEPSPPGPFTTFAAVGDSTAVAAKLDEFRAALGGGLNAPGTLAQPGGRREINWDGVPAVLTNNDDFPFSFFNAVSPRGAVFNAPGSRFRVDSTAFASVSAGLAGTFKPFLAKKMFMPVASRFLDVRFFVVGCPRSTAAAVAGTSSVPSFNCTAADLGVVTGFGVVFSDVDRAGSSRIELFDAHDVLLASVDAPARRGSQEHAFAGAVFPSAVVSRVRIASGEAALNESSTDVSLGGAFDLVVMDDFVYGEPRPTPQ